MALPTITVEDATGSNTQASGSGGTAVFGTGAATVSATNTVNLSVDTPDLSGVATDGSAALWVSSSSGRQWSKITAVNNTTKIVTTQDNYANTEGSRTWAIGGKRDTLAGSLRIAQDAYEGWTLQINDSQTITAAYVVAPSASAADGKFVITGNSPSSRPVITNSSNTPTFSFTGSTSTLIKDLEARNSNGTKTSAIFLNSNTASTTSAIIRNCVIGDSTNKIGGLFSRSGGTTNAAFIDCEIKNLNNSAVVSSATGSFIFLGNYIHDNTSHGLGGGQMGTSCVIARNLIVSNGGDGVNVAASSFINSFAQNTISSNTGDGLDTSASATIIRSVYNNNFTTNGGYGWNAAANTDNALWMSDFNNYGTGGTANTSGARNNVSAGTNDLAVDPGYIATGSANYGVGANVQDVGFQISTRNIGANNSGTVNYSAIGCAEPQVTGGGGGTVGYGWVG